MSETDDDSQSPDRHNQDACSPPGLVPRPLISLGPGVQGLFLGKSGAGLGLPVGAQTTQLRQARLPLHGHEAKKDRWRRVVHNRHNRHNRARQTIQYIILIVAR